MIVLPRRSVTRFFIPLIDVLTLLFCIFLLMPMVRPSDSEGNTVADLEKLREMERELERLRKQGRQLTPELEKELKRLREEKLKTLEQRLLIRVLQIDATTGKLTYSDPEPIEVRNETDARELIERDSRSQGADHKETYYLILYPRDRTSPYPLRGQREQYDRWFGSVAHGWDVPGSGPAHGGLP
jgi:hypothetical protein